MPGHAPGGPSIRTAVRTLRTSPVLAAVGPATPCTADQLAAGFAAGTSGPEQDWGSVDLVDTSASPCVLSGQIVVLPVGADGNPLTVPRHWQHIQVVHDVLLSAHGEARYGRPIPTGDTWAEVVVGGLLHPHTARGAAACPAAHVVTPAYWRIRVHGVRLDVANHAAESTPATTPAVHACGPRWLPVHAFEQG